MPDMILVARVLVALAVPAFLFLWLVPKVQARGANLNAPDKAVERIQLENTLRETWAKVLGGTAILFTAWTTLQNLNLAQEAQITDNYSKALLNLSDEKSGPKHEGGIYALERIARESEKDYWPIMQLLDSFVRAQAPQPASKSCASDVQAALTVLARRNRVHHHSEDENQVLDLHETCLRDANLYETDMARAALWGCNLEGASFRGAKLYKASLQTSNLQEADLRDADLHEADLQKADLRKADLRQARLCGAKLSGADLSGARIDGCFYDQATAWPVGYSQDSHGAKRVTSCP